PSGLSIDYGTSTPQAVVVDRSRFDRGLAERARAAGAEIRTGTRVRTMTTDAHIASAVVGDQTVTARLIILACGASYGVQRRSGLGLPAQYLPTAQSELPARRLHDVEVHFGHDVAPSGFAWAVPVERPHGSFVRVGVMTSHDAPRSFGRMLSRVADR